jgi:hypothetical protein
MKGEPCDRRSPFRPIPLLSFEHASASVYRGFSEILLDAQELIIFTNTIRAGRRAGFDLPGIGSHRNIRNRRIFGLSGTVRYHSRVAGFVSHLNGIQRFGEGTNLIDLDQDGIADTSLNAFEQALRIGHE